MDPASIQLIDRLANNIAGVLHRLFGFSYSRNEEHFVYQVTINTAVNFTTATTLTTSLPFTQEADFVCTRVCCNARSLANNTATLVGGLVGIAGANPAAGDLPDAPFLVAFQDGATDRQLQNAPVDAALCYGQMGGLPGIWSKPRLFARNSNLGIAVTLLKNAVNAADSLAIRIALMGWKIYDASSLDLTSRRP